MLATSVDPVERLLVQKAGKTVLVGDFAHQLHRQLVLVGGDVALGKDRGKLMLARGDLVVAGLGVDTQLPQFLVQIFHVAHDPRSEGTEIVVAQFLPLRRTGTEQGAAGIDQVGSLAELFLVDQEVLLLAADGGHHPAYLVMAEQVQDTLCLLVQSLHAAQ